MRRGWQVMLGLVVVLGVIMGVRVLAGGDEDTWICEAGRWVKHGDPRVSQPTQECVDTKLLGGDTDEHGCIGSAGYTWCEAKKKCLREWEEPCTHEAAFTILQHIKLSSNLPFSSIQPGEFTIPPSQGGWVMEGRVMDLSGGGEVEANSVGDYLVQRGLSKSETVDLYTVYRNNEMVCMVDREKELRVVCAEVGK